MSRRLSLLAIHPQDNAPDLALVAGVKRLVHHAAVKPNVQLKLPTRTVPSRSIKQAGLALLRSRRTFAVQNCFVLVVLVTCAQTAFSTTKDCTQTGRAGHWLHIDVAI